MLVLTGCEINQVVEEKEVTYDFVYHYEDKEIAKDDFSLACFSLIITVDGEETVVDVTNDMLMDAINFETSGEYVVGLTYKGYSEFFNVKINVYGVANVDMDYYAKANGLTGEALKLALREIISVTKKNETYGDLRYDLQKTDASLTTPGKIYDFYSQKEMNATWDYGETWNREHVWPRSKSWYPTTDNSYTGAGSDLHAVRPCDSIDNSVRSNKPFGVGNGYYEPADCSKGDVARIIFYMLTRYSETDNLYIVTNVAQSMDLLLTWNELDPVDDIERQRNEVAYSIVGNRNPFIDYPEYAYYIWDESRLSKTSDTGDVAFSPNSSMINIIRKEYI